MYSSILSLTSKLDGELLVNATPRPFYPRERPSTNCIGGWVGPRAGLDEWEDLAPTKIRYLDQNQFGKILTHSKSL